MNNRKHKSNLLFAFLLIQIGLCTAAAEEMDHNDTMLEHVESANSFTIFHMLDESTGMKSAHNKYLSVLESKDPEYENTVLTLRSASNVSRYDSTDYLHMFEDVIIRSLLSGRKHVFYGILGLSVEYTNHKDNQNFGKRNTDDFKLNESHNEFCNMVMSSIFDISYSYLQNIASDHFRTEFTKNQNTLSSHLPFQDTIKEMCGYYLQTLIKWMVDRQKNFDLEKEWETGIKDALYNTLHEKIAEYESIVCGNHEKKSHHKLLTTAFDIPDYFEYIIKCNQETISTGIKNIFGAFIKIMNDPNNFMLFRDCLVNICHQTIQFYHAATTSNYFPADDLTHRMACLEQLYTGRQYLINFYGGFETLRDLVETEFTKTSEDVGKPMHTEYTTRIIFNEPILENNLGQFVRVLQDSRIFINIFKHKTVYVYNDTVRLEGDFLNACYHIKSDDIVYKPNDRIDANDIEAEVYTTVSETNKCLNNVNYKLSISHTYTNVYEKNDRSLFQAHDTKACALDQPGNTRKPINFMQKHRSSTVDFTGNEGDESYRSEHDRLLEQMFGNMNVSTNVEEEMTM